MDKKGKGTPKGGAKPTGARNAPATTPKRTPAKQAQVTLPPLDNIFDAANRGELTTEQQVVAFRDWYTAYFTQVFRTYTRETVGKKISPGDWHMKTALDMLPVGAIELPPHERAKCFFPLEMLLRAIADAWEDAAAPALSAAYHWGEVKRFHVHEYGDGTKPMPAARAQEKIDEVDGHLRDMKAELNELSAQLLKANPHELQQTLADIKKAVGDIGDKMNETHAAANMTLKIARTTNVALTDSIDKQGKVVRKLNAAADKIDNAADGLKDIGRDLAETTEAVQDAMESMRTIADDVHAGREAAETAAEQSRLAADGTTRIEGYTQDLKPAIDGLYEEINADQPGTEDVNTKARAAILTLYGDFMAHKLDHQFPEMHGRHTQRKFIDLCGEMKAYERIDGTIVTVNECLPGGVKQLHDLVHARDQEKHAAK